MKAIGFNAPFNLEDGNQFQEIEFNIPNPTRNQLLIKVQSISVNRLIRNNASYQLTMHHVY